MSESLHGKNAVAQEGGRAAVPAQAAADRHTAGLDVYIVGGAVRDALLGLPAGDRDWVVVGSTPEEMATRGFIPVGGDFPVFLHPDSKEEYALARTERKSGRGYKGFVFHAGRDVTLGEDLRRRDLTVNAIARAADGRLVDPLDGQADLRARVLRHVGDAFVEDPVRLLRLARFAARFDDFTVAPETMELARRLVRDGEVDALVPERVWKEMAKGLATQHPSRMFEVLEAATALQRVLPGLVFDAEVARGVDIAARVGLPVAARFALLLRCSAQPAELARHVKAPAHCVDCARLLPVVLAADGGAARARGPQDWLALMERCDALRKPQRFIDLLEAAACVELVDVAAWRARLDAVQAVDAGSIAKSSGPDARQIQAAVRAARLAALADADTA
ncbi:tRNA CCA-pyrophosphorylase [Candidimonas humi]|uniref:tRNA CCA-pyrophosphorylase n=1 Tax=Candidimonas humi TaxID=683355 RepID=A0ABV8NYE9_9BURK|nr:tRNA CCA-pyrophosphorylase [Candidimonas humi]